MLVAKSFYPFLCLALWAPASPATQIAPPRAAPTCVVQSDAATRVGALRLAGQRLIREQRYDEAIAAFSCLVADDPSSPDGYRGRAEAKLLQKRFAEAFADYARITAFVLPNHPDAWGALEQGYVRRLERDPDDMAALTGLSFARWTAYDNAGALPLFERLGRLAPSDVYGTLFAASNKLFLGLDTDQALGELDRAIRLAPTSADVRYIVADAYTYAHPDLDRAFVEATRAYESGLDIPRVHAILANCGLASGRLRDAARHLLRHFDLVTTQSIALTTPLQRGETVPLDLAPGRTFELLLELKAGEELSVRTGGAGATIYDSIAVLIGPDGTPVAGNDDLDGFLAGFDWTSSTGGTYRLRVTSFEGVGTGTLDVLRL